ncbi:helix-turn-helix transcriptional regulator [Mumia sp. ZJ1417]|uniref:helix-turn-helix domain-containing protein n=1 Tax=unclassified Mumia TaxID=2621872 RepID=UPI0014244615|nr:MULTISPECIES: helix-turn-helix transcriptional regulator [unclassified Mumia]QMW65608.1 helix-turn-helix transcriptional regulator [Mumia sp. ZJ1417]
MSGPDVEANQRAQAALYGEPLGVIVRRCAEVLGLTQARVAAALGISAPMLSQLANGHRVKIGNPAAVSRLQAMYAAAQGVASGRATREEALAGLASQEGVAVVTSWTTPEASAVRALFRTEGSASDFEEAAALVADAQPRIAALLRRYGADG